MASSPKTVPTKESATAFLNTITDEQMRKDCKQILKMMQDITGEKPVMWGTAIVGFGSYRYVYASGHSGDWPVAAFSPRKQNISVYLIPGFDRFEHLLKKLGKHKTAVSCLYIKKLSDIDQDVLRTLIRESVEQVKLKYGK